MQNVLVTGATTGIGLESALAFASKGYRVFAGARKPEQAEHLHNAIGQGLPLSIVPLDVDRDESVEAAVKSVLAAGGRIDVLVNNAGFGGGGPIEMVSLTLAKALFETNYFGAIRMIRAVLPGMRAQRSGAIVNITSVVGRVVWAAHAHYTASKHALEAASEALAAEVRPHGIRVAVIEPGAVLTPIWQKASGELDPEGPYGLVVRRLWQLFHAQLTEPTMPSEIAEVVVHAVEAKEPRLRYLAGVDAEIGAPARERMSDEEWIDLQTEPDDERFLARAREAFGLDLYQPPSARARIRRTTGTG